MQPQAPNQILFLVNVNSMCINMQLAFLNNMKYAIEERGLDGDIYRPKLEMPAKDGKANILSRDEILNLNNGPMDPEVVEACMMDY